MTDTLKIETGKEYLLRNGWRMRCYATDGGGRFPVHGAYQNDDGEWVHESWSESGGILIGDFDHQDLDIVSEAPKPIEVDCWVWVYEDAADVMMPYEYGKGGPERLSILGAPAMPFPTTAAKPDAQKRIQFTILPGEGL